MSSMKLIRQILFELSTGNESVTDGQKDGRTDGRTDGGDDNTPSAEVGRGVKMYIQFHKTINVLMTFKANNNIDTFILNNVKIAS